MECMFNKNDIILYYKWLNNSKFYFEYGSGGSTYNSVINENIEYVFSVETDPIWYEKLCSKLINYKNKFRYFFIDLNTSPNTYGVPGGAKLAGVQGECSLPKNIEEKNNWKKYSDVFIELDNDIKNNIDLILIDGRFRVCCCLKIFEHINFETIILFDDFKNRKWFQIVLNYFEIIDSNKNGNMVALRKKNVIKPSIEIIEKYEIDYR